MGTRRQGGGVGDGPVILRWGVLWSWVVMSVVPRGRAPQTAHSHSHSWFPQVSIEELEQSLVIKVNKDAVMKIVVAGNLFQQVRGLYHLNLTVGGIPFKEKDLVQPVSVLVDAGVRVRAWGRAETWVSCELPCAG